MIIYMFRVNRKDLPMMSFKNLASNFVRPGITKQENSIFSFCNEHRCILSQNQKNDWQEIKRSFGTFKRRTMFFLDKEADLEIRNMAENRKFIVNFHII